MAAYATVADVKARLGRFAPVLAAPASPQHPNEDDATALLADVSAEIDLAIEARGFDPSQLSATAKAGLKDLVAFGAIARVLAGVPSDPEQDKLSQFASSLWRAAMGDPTATDAHAVAGSIRSGSHPVIAALEGGGESAGAGASAGDFWSEEPEYGTQPWIRAQQAQVASGAIAPGELPQFVRGMSG